ncbi:M13 family metallopeptidase [Pseudomarimonas arenosa]|uniref:Peptidase n=1 Tax=Pseudomarimonas arenosa TaxID=2774145 RepID=A0AAW3ZRP2_9GAMM|nr:M13-type metalloendopeptidase [Pseudomarimonas arenosa]MBD8527739.1 peptidase [Pseudomarimonas arenosa]
MRLNAPKLGLLSLAITLSLGACSQQQAEAPAPQATAPAPVEFKLDESKLPAVVSYQASDLNAEVPVCQNLADHVNSTWLAANPVPADRSTWGSFETLGERSLGVQKQIVEAAGGNAGATGVEKLIGDIWATGMDEAAINAAGINPIAEELQRIAALKDGREIAQYLRDSAARGDGFLFGFGPSADFKDSNMNIAYAVQAGLGLPDPSVYSSDREDHQKNRADYLAHIANVLKLAGDDEATAQAKAEQIMAFETRLAKVSLTRKEIARDVSKYYNPVSLEQADELTPNFSWTAFFESQGVAKPAMFSLAMPDFHKEVSAMLEEVPAEQWQAYLRFHTIDNASPYLADAFAQENFNFYGKALRGQEEMQERWKRVLNTINGTTAEALGQLYVKHAFPPESKTKMQALVKNLSDALKIRLENLEWMSAETKAKALEKWASFTPKIGYPDKWRDWSGLITSRDSYVGNIMAANGFNYQFELAKIGKPVDKSEWGMPPQMVNAYYNPQQNEIVFPAAILQPPFFDPSADPALNYGGIGAVIGHEMIHGYDDQGSRFDANGNFENWWTDADRQGFEALTEKLVAQFNEYESIDGIHVDGKLTLGENIADLGGLSVAHSALQAALAADPSLNTEIDGQTQEQRFFMNWATVWRRNFKPEELKVRLSTDSHAPANFRAIGAPSNLPAMATAFSCQEGDPMVRAEAERIVIW